MELGVSPHDSKWENCKDLPSSPSAVTLVTKRAGVASISPAWPWAGGAAAFMGNKGRTKCCDREGNETSETVII